MVYSNDPQTQAQSVPPQQNDVELSLQRKPTVIGIYGISGCGKSYLLKQLKEQLGTTRFNFHDGSSVISEIVPGGLAAFQKLPEIEKILWRKAAIEKIKKDAYDNEKVAVVSGHYLFWSEGSATTQLVGNENDLNAYTHIIYLDTPPNTIHDRRARDTVRKRSECSREDLHKWQQEEKAELRKACYNHFILYSVIQDAPDLVKKVLILLKYFEDGTEIKNRYQAEQEVGIILAKDDIPLKTVLVIDADKTLCAKDTGEIFWEIASKDGKWDNPDCPLKQLFGSKLGYSYTAFRQAMLLYEEFESEDFNILCEKVASEITIHADFLSLLHLVQRQRHVRAVVVTCGLRLAWEKILRRAGFADKILVIGGSRIKDGYVVTPDIKANIVMYLQNHGIKVWCFGDSVLDLPMLKKSDQALIVVCNEENRSQRMEGELRAAIEVDNLHAFQVIIPASAAPRLDTKILPIVKLSNSKFIHSLVEEHYCATQLKVNEATSKNACKILMSPTRDALVKGPFLRSYHQNVGKYLSLVFVTEIIGLEEHPILHVQGRLTPGYRLLHEQNTLIVALMRGGEPMALGVNKIFPLAEFLHAFTIKDIQPEHLDGKFTIILVDSVINNGDTMEEFIKHISELHATAHIIMVTGVAQSQSIDKLKQVQKAIKFNQLSLVALRLSDNKFKGQGVTDTGNRLFNTTNRA